MNDALSVAWAGLDPKEQRRMLREAVRGVVREQIESTVSKLAAEVIPDVVRRETEKILAGGWRDSPGGWTHNLSSRLAVVARDELEERVRAMPIDVRVTFGEPPSTSEKPTTPEAA